MYVCMYNFFVYMYYMHITHQQSQIISRSSFPTFNVTEHIYKKMLAAIKQIITDYNPGIVRL